MLIINYVYDNSFFPRVIKNEMKRFVLKTIVTITRAVVILQTTARHCIGGYTQTNCCRLVVERKWSNGLNKKAKQNKTKQNKTNKTKQKQKQKQNKTKNKNKNQQQQQQQQNICGVLLLNR